jgi:hypothetical protein
VGERTTFFEVVGSEDAADMRIVFGVTIGFGVGGKEGSERSIPGRCGCKESCEIRGHIAGEQARSEDA